MTDLETKLMKRAAAIHDRIFPCASQHGFDQCFTREEGKLYFWYNTGDDSTHLLVADALGRIEQAVPAYGCRRAGGRPARV
jgi:hypothetical protein